MMLERIGIGVICFAGPVNRYGVVSPDTTRRWIPRFGRTIRRWAVAS